MSDNPREDFKQNIQGNNFLEALKSIIVDVIELEILTVVEETSISSSPVNQDIKNVTGQSGKRIYTKIGLLEGDIKNIIGEDFIKDESYQELRQFHEGQVNKGQTIIKNNLETLKTALNTLIEIQQKEKAQKISNPS